VEVEHSGVEVVVAEDDLEVANESAPMESMGGERVTQRLPIILMN
jgi:hypothetical protein